MSGEPFFCVQLFDHEGYFGCVRGFTLEGLRVAAAKRSAKREIVACSLPFPGSWSGKTMDVSAPPNFKEVLSLLEKTDE